MVMMDLLNYSHPNWATCKYLALLFLVNRVLGDIVSTDHLHLILILLV